MSGLSLREIINDWKIKYLNKTELKKNSGKILTKV